MASSILAGWILGGILGYRAHHLNVSRPIGAAFGVAWRIGIVWFALAVFAEFSAIYFVETASQVATETRNHFPFIFFYLVIGISSAFLLGYLASAIWSGLASMSGQNLIQVLVPVVGILISIFLAIRSDFREEEKRSVRSGEVSRLEEEQSEQIRLLQEQIKLLQEQNKKDDAPEEPITTGESVSVPTQGADVRIE